MVHPAVVILRRVDGQPEQGRAGDLRGNMHVMSHHNITQYSALVKLYICVLSYNIYMISIHFNDERAQELRGGEAV